MKVAKYISALLLLACAVLAAGCSSSAKPERAHGTTLTVYVSLPRQGVSAREAELVAQGARLALSDSRGRAGGKHVRLVELDSSKPGGQTWDPATVEANARRAAADPTAIAYIGELDAGASSISLPVTNDKAILQVSPEDGLTGLTRQEPGGPPATRPERFYPTGRRTFLRLVPTDYDEASALVAWMHARGVERLGVVQDQRLGGRELAAQIRYAAGRQGVTIAAGVEATDDPASYPALAKKVADGRPQAVVFTGVGNAPSGALLTTLARALPGVPLYAGSALATAEPAPPGLPPVSVVKPGLAPAAYGPRAHRVLARLARQRGTRVPVEALYGYEAMRVVIDALNSAGAESDDRVAVVRAALAPRLRHSVLGDYRVLATGDVSTERLGSFRRRGERLAWLGPRAPAPAAR